jgi:hypothetical protein
MRPFHTVTVRFGPPVTYLHAGETVVTGRCGEPGGAEGTGEPGETGGTGSEPARRDLDQAELRCLTDALMTAIAGLSGQEYVDRYAGRGHTAAASEAASGGEASGGPRAPRSSGARSGRAAGVARDAGGPRAPAV